MTQMLNGLRREGVDLEAGAFEVVYEELRRIAARTLASETAAPTLTGVVHETFLRLRNRDHWKSRREFYFVAARVVRHFLIDEARKRAATRPAAHGHPRTRIGFQRSWKSTS